MCNYIILNESERRLSKLLLFKIHEISVYLYTYLLNEIYYD